MTMTGKGTAALSVLLLAAAIALPGPAVAQGSQAESPQPMPVQFPPQHTRTASNGFDWLAPTRNAGTLPVTTVYQIGQGSYICAPAGFGRKSRCYAN